MDAPRRTESPLHAQAPGLTQSLRAWVLASAAALALIGVLVLLHRWTLGREILSPLQGQVALSPLYAFWRPLLRPEALVFVAVATTFVVLAPRWCDAERTSPRRFGLLLALASLVLPLALFLVRDDLGALGQQFVYYANEEFWHDAQRIPGLADRAGNTGAMAFVSNYVELMPQLSLHGRHFPPGHALWLHSIASSTGGGLFVAALSVLAAFALALQFTLQALRTRLSEPAARQATLLVLAAPAALDFACTSMDAVFLMWSSLALWLTLRAQRRGATLGSCCAAGLALAAAVFSSFAALPVALFLLLDAAFSPTDERRGRLRALALVAAFAGLALLLLALLTGFSILDCFLEARRSNTAFMEHTLGASTWSRWPTLATGNLAAALLGAGLGLVAALLLRLRSPLRGDTWTLSTLACLALFATAGLFYLETERIWLFTLPWIAGSALAVSAWSRSTLRAALAVTLAVAGIARVCTSTLW